MKFSYKFSNLLGTVYRHGDIIFSKDGNTVLCPVGNKISLYNLKSNLSTTLPIEAKFNYNCLALSPNGFILLAASEDGEVQIINMNFKRVLYKKKFNRSIKCIKFSPDGRHFALGKENIAYVYSTPGADNRIFDPFVMERLYHGSYSEVTCLNWSFDSRILAIGYEDGSSKICGFTKFDNLREYAIGGSTTKVVGAFFESNSYNLFTVSSDGVMSSWICSTSAEKMIVSKDPYKREVKSDEKEEDNAMELDDLPLTREEQEEQMKKTINTTTDTEDEKKIKFYYKRKQRCYLNQHLKGAGTRITVTAATYHPKLKLMTTACSSGDFLLFDMSDEAALVHSLNISDQTISGIAFNPTGDWLALGVSSAGQLLVWEWQSETYVLKQQGHFNNMRVTTYSPDGQVLATGGEDGKIKLWSTHSSFCYITFSEHTAAVTGLVFTQSGRAILSSSLDGTVRAFDLTRYRNFKTLTSPRPTQFTCISVDTSGDLVTAGGQDCHSIYLWSLQTGKLLEVLGGHEGPIVSMQFSPQPGSTMMVSTGWDGTVRVWNAIATTTVKETINIGSDGLCVTFRPDGKQIAVACMDGQITMFNPETGKQENNIVGRSDLGAGRSDSDKITAKKNLLSKAFTTLSYSSDGEYILAGGQSKNVCIYFIAEELLIKKFEVTQNRSFDAMDEIIDRKKMAEGGINLALVEQREEGSTTLKLPGTKSGDKSKRTFRPDIRVTSLTFSPTGRSWAACTSEGLLVYSLDNDWLFDPLQLDIDNTPSAVKAKLKNKEYSKALMMAIRLNIKSVKQEVLETIPYDFVDLIVSELSLMYVEGTLVLLAELLDRERHIGLYSYWIKTLLTRHGPLLKSRSRHIVTTINNLQKSLTNHYGRLNKMCSHNQYTLDYLVTQAAVARKRKLSIDDDDSNNDESDVDEGYEMSDGSHDEGVEV